MQLSRTVDLINMFIFAASYPVGPVKPKFKFNTLNDHRYYIEHNSLKFAPDACLVINSLAKFIEGLLPYKALVFFKF